MRAIAPVGPTLGESIAAKLKRFFLAIFTLHKAIPSSQQRSGPRVPKQRYDAVNVLVWLVLVPFSCGWFWYVIYGLIRALMERL